jgi:HAL2 family 3'(2'),5'-bisphosphate nucleotidase
MYSAELNHAVELVAHACTIGHRVQADIAAAGGATTKDDRSPVTVADLAIQAVVSHRLAELYPDHALLAEEEAETLRRDPTLAERVLGLVSESLPGITSDQLLTTIERVPQPGSDHCWVLDPIDGTKGFLRGDQYAIALALVVRGRVVLGVLGCPRLGPGPGSSGEGPGRVFAAERGRGSSSRSIEGGEFNPIHVDDLTETSEAAFCESVEAAHAAHSDQAAIAGRLGISRPPVRIDSQCKYAVVARGEASIYLRLPRDRDYREKAWDHAAGSVIIEEAGGRVSDLYGEPLDFSAGRFLARHHGIVATNGHLHDRVLAACREVLGLD